MRLGSDLRFAACIAFLLGCASTGSPQLAQGPQTPSGGQPAATYFVDCTSQANDGNGAQTSPLISIKQVNALSLHAGDSVLFKRGSTCLGEFQPHGSGMKDNPIRIGAYGQGPLPRIQAQPADQSAFRLYNQSFWEISSLDLAGGTTYGFYAGGDVAELQYLHLRDVRIHDVRGPLKRKESGLVVIRASTDSTNYQDIELDGIDAYDSTQWAGIFISGASHVRVRNSTVHDVQGDGIVVFHGQDAIISRSLAWHTGMQHQFTIGTPNAIWTWNCTDCTVEENEAFLTDSPGIDGGAFDIDFGNTRNTVRQNFGHDTAGYCVSVFGAFGPTTDSLIADNLCVNNGMSPRLAQRQGSILLMTWQRGRLDGVQISGNRIYWGPPGQTPALQSGEDLKASGVVLHANEIWSTGPSFVDPTLHYTGDHNRYRLVGDDPGKQPAMPAGLASHETGSTLTTGQNDPDMIGKLSLAETHTAGWRLELNVPAQASRGDTDADLRGTLVELRSSVLQFGHCGLKVIARGPALLALRDDWSLVSDGISVSTSTLGGGPPFSLRLISPTGKLVREWNTYPSPVDLGFVLRQNIGPPDYSYLPFEEVRATD